jgi:hypothetical protein
MKLGGMDSRSATLRFRATDCKSAASAIAPPGTGPTKCHVTSDDMVGSQVNNNNLFVNITDGG